MHLATLLKSLIDCSYSTLSSFAEIALLLCLSYICESESCSAVSDSLWPQGLYSAWNSLGQNTGMGSLSLLHRLFPTQGSNPGGFFCSWILFQLTTREAQEYWSGSLSLPQLLFLSSQILQQQFLKVKLLLDHTMELINILWDLFHKDQHNFQVLCQFTALD